ncbi:hypothetical protein Esi_0000_0199 [Ectocarpus siliculosus]|uniref:Uncharacterized protein n=1 Tax=Ectocarpus siliculosus TaxID=2880 RepID=D8LB25_ECTSI|nr:hypothetical protein Esi_0000_0199 [Ectocarpus siliculosus]|eukprot:CBN76534.1 hypothetical protein Esi_0000_0199 [Ectocarpus siliculosus]
MTSEPVDHGVSRACGRDERPRKGERDEVRRGRKHVLTDGFVKVISSAAWRQWTCPSRRGIHEAAGAGGQTGHDLIVSAGSVHAEVVEPVTSEPRPGVAVGIVAVVPEPNSWVSLGARPGRTPETPRGRQASTSSVPDGRAPISSSLRGPFDTRGHWEQLGWASSKDEPLRMEKSARPTVGPMRVSTDGFVKVISSAAWRQWMCPSRRGITRRRGRLAKPVTTIISLDRLGPCRGR